MEPSRTRLNKYDVELTDAEIERKDHRRHVGGRWRQIGRLQLDFLVAQGLLPHHRLLDVGCGALRGGVHLIPYLEPGHYFGIDSNESLLRAGLEHEVPEAGLGDRLPAANLRMTARFEAGFGVRFDYALAVSVFTHLPLNHVQLCLYELSQVMAPGGRFFASFFVPDASAPFSASTKQVKVFTHPERDPFHYRPEALAWAARSGVGDWSFRYIGDWGHPRGQMMGEFRLDGGARRPRARSRPRWVRALRRALRT